MCCNDCTCNYDSCACKLENAECAYERESSIINDEIEDYYNTKDE